MELHQKLIELANRLPVIFVSAHGDIEMAVKAMRRGAVDFLTKPVVDEKLLSSIDRAVARSCEEAAEAETVRELAGLWQALSPRECQVAQLAAEGLHPDVIVLDPPRKGCDEATLSAVVQMSPRRVVYVSCNPSTAARDAKWLEEKGYHAEKVQPVDLFPRTKHVEAIVSLQREI